MSNHDGDVSENFYGLLSGDTNYIKTHSLDNNTIEENTQNWPINVSSWAGPNVTSTFRGFVIKYEDLTSIQSKYLLRSSVIWSIRFKN